MSSSATMQAGTFVSAVQTSKRAMREPTFPILGKRRRQAGGLTERRTDTLSEADFILASPTKLERLDVHPAVDGRLPAYRGL